MSALKPPTSHTQTTPPPDCAPVAKKPYQKPAFVREQLFETMALACGKTNPVIGQCRTVRKNS
jgi:hypothetical protein